MVSSTKDERAVGYRRKAIKPDSKRGLAVRVREQYDRLIVFTTLQGFFNRLKSEHVRYSL